MHQPNAGPLATYNSLCDEHLSEYFASPRRINHLQKMGLITPDRKIMDEETVRAKSAFSERKQREEEMIASAIVSEAVDLERKRRAALKNKLDLLARYELAEKIKNQKRQSTTSEGLVFSPRLSPRLQVSSILGLRKDKPTPILEHDMQKYLNKISLPNSLPLPRTNPYGLENPYATRDPYWPDSPYVAQSLHVAPKPRSQQNSYMISDLYGTQSPYGSQFLSQSSISNLQAQSSNTLLSPGPCMDQRMDLPSSEIINLNLPQLPVTPPSTPINPGPRDVRPLLVTRSKTAPARLTRRQKKEGPKEQLKIQSPVRSNVKITLRYLGRCSQVKRFCSNTVEVLQQHCGGNTVSLFKGELKEKDTFSFVSRRHIGMPFGLSVYVDGLIDCRVSTCCEYKHSPGKLIGPAKQAHFAVVGIEGGTPCSSCEKEMQSKTTSAAKQSAIAETSVQVQGISEEVDISKKTGQQAGKNVAQTLPKGTESSTPVSQPYSKYSLANQPNSLSTARNSTGQPSNHSVREAAHLASHRHPLVVRHEVASAGHAGSPRPLRPSVQSRAPSHPQVSLPSLKLSPSHMPLPLHVPPLQGHSLLAPSSQVQPSSASPSLSLQAQPTEVPPSQPLQMPIPPLQAESPQMLQIPTKQTETSQMLPSPSSPAPISIMLSPVLQPQQQPSLQIEAPPQTSQVSVPLLSDTAIPTSEAPQASPLSLEPLPLCQVPSELEDRALTSQLALSTSQDPPQQATVTQEQLIQFQPLQIHLIPSEAVTSQTQQSLPQISASHLQFVDQEAIPDAPPPPLQASPSIALEVHMPAPLDNGTPVHTLHRSPPKTSDVAAGPSEVYSESGQYEAGMNESLAGTGQEEDDTTTNYGETEDEKDTEREGNTTEDNESERDIDTVEKGSTTEDNLSERGTENVERVENVTEENNESDTESEIEKGNEEESEVEKDESEKVGKEYGNASYEEEIFSHDEVPENEASSGTRDDETEMEEDNEMEISTKGSGFIDDQTPSLRPSTPLPPFSENEFEAVACDEKEITDGMVEVEIVSELSGVRIATSSGEFITQSVKEKDFSVSTKQTASVASLSCLGGQNQAQNAPSDSSKRPYVWYDAHKSKSDLSCVDSHESQTDQHTSTHLIKENEQSAMKAHKLPNRTASVVEKTEKTNAEFCHPGLQQISLHLTKPIENVTGIVQSNDMMDDVQAHPQENQPKSYSASSFEKATSSVHDEGKSDEDMAPCLQEPQPTSYSTSSFDSQSESLEKSQGDDKDDGRTSRCSQKRNDANSRASRYSSPHSCELNLPTAVVLTEGDKKHNDNIKNSPFVPSSTDQDGQPLLHQAASGARERREKLDRKLSMDSAASAFISDNERSTTKTS